MEILRDGNYKKHIQIGLLSRIDVNNVAAIRPWLLWKQFSVVMYGYVAYSMEAGVLPGHYNNQ